MATKGLDLDNARKAIMHGRGTQVKVAIIDSGVEKSHPQLKDIDLVDDLTVESNGNRLRIAPGGGRDVFGHGTAVAGVIKALAPEVRIGSIRVLGHDNTSRTAIILRAAQ